jgi:hypothetical protein
MQPFLVLSSTLIVLWACGKARAVDAYPASRIMPGCYLLSITIDSTGTFDLSSIRNSAPRYAIVRSSSSTRDTIALDSTMVASEEASDRGIRRSVRSPRGWLHDATWRIAGDSLFLEYTIPVTVGFSISMREIADSLIGTYFWWSHEGRASWGSATARQLAGCRQLPAG